MPIDNRQYYAIKVIEKIKLIDRNEGIKSTLIEYQVLSQVNRPFLCNLNYAYMSPERIYFVMPLVKGGQIQKLMNEKKHLGISFSEDLVRFYITQVILGLGKLHKNNIVHRDIKTSNIMVSENGYIKIIDFGEARILTFG